MKTTLTEILKYNLSEQNKQKLSLISTTDSIDFMTIYEIIGIKDAIWCLKVFDYKDYCLFLADVAESVLPIFEAKNPDINEPREAIEGIRAWHNGDINSWQLNILSDAAYTAADAATTAYVAAFVAAYAATAYAAYDAAFYTACTAVNAGSDWEKIEELFIEHFGDKQ